MLQEKADADEERMKALASQKAELEDAKKLSQEIEIVVARLKQLGLVVNFYVEEKKHVWLKMIKIIHYVPRSISLQGRMATLCFLRLK